MRLVYSIHTPRETDGGALAQLRNQRNLRERETRVDACALPFFLETRTAAAIIYFFSMGTNERIVSQSRAFMSSSGRDYVVGMRRREGEA